MKKNLLKVLALAFVLALALTFTGCGSKDNGASVPNSQTTDRTPEKSDPSSSDETPDDDSDADNGNDTDTADASGENDDAGSSGEGTPLDELVADPDMQEIAKQMSNEQYTAELLAENGNILIFHFTLVEQLDLSDESLKETIVDALNSGLDSYASTYESLLDSFRSELEMDDLVIRIEYFNADGSEIVTKDFE